MKEYRASGGEVASVTNPALQRHNHDFCIWRKENERREGGSLAEDWRRKGEKEIRWKNSFKSKEFICIEKSSSESDHDRGSKRKASDNEEEKEEEAVSTAVRTL